uniref:Uncharacterized protein n=1 Tax=Myoviridae sp. ctt8G1 TaxID=2827713 RepID=A0A8S5TGR6_9CAUD|nr:MAG TPA: hypothetical protein [Myoviridae sp. ctt8G1]
MTFGKLIVGCARPNGQALLTLACTTIPMRF